MRSRSWQRRGGCKTNAAPPHGQTAATLGAVTQTVYIAGLGFRRPGLRLAAPISVERSDRTLTVRQLIATDDGTDLLYDFTSPGGQVIQGPNEDRPWIGSSPEKVVVRTPDGEHQVSAAGRASTSVDARRAARKWSAPPLPLFAGSVELSLSSPIVGEWTVPIELVPFGEALDERAVTVDASATRNGITIRVRAIAATATETVIGIGLDREGRGAKAVGIGGLHGNREGPSALVLHDAAGRTWHERRQLDRVARDHVGGTDVALFDPLPDDARELVLDVPFVYVMDPGEVEIALPVTSSSDALLGTHPIRILGSAVGTPRSAPPQFGPALQLSLELGEWHNDERVLMPWRMKVDGQDRGMGTGGMNTVDPQPVGVIEALGPDVTSASTIALIGAWIQVRGPWRIDFSR